MTDISSLQQTVAAAQEAFERTGEQHARSRKHLTSLIAIVEENLREKRVALAQNEAQRERMVREYGQLRHMLHALAMTVEAGTPKDLASIPAPAEAGMEPGAGMEHGAGMEPGAHPGSRMGPVYLDPVANDAGPARSSGADSEQLRAGLKRVIKKKRAQADKVDKPEEPAPAN